MGDNDIFPFPIFAYMRFVQQKLRNIFTYIYIYIYIYIYAETMYGLFLVKDMQTPPPPPLSFDHSLFIDDTEPLTLYK